MIITDMFFSSYLSEEQFQDQLMEESLNPQTWQAPKEYFFLTICISIYIT